MHDTRHSTVPLTLFNLHGCHASLSLHGGATLTKVPKKSMVGFLLTTYTPQPHHTATRRGGPGVAILTHYQHHTASTGGQAAAVLSPGPLESELSQWAITREQKGCGKAEDRLDTHLASLTASHQTTPRSPPPSPPPPPLPYIITPKFFTHQFFPPSKRPVPCFPSPRSSNIDCLIFGEKF
ncbi:hypothetical protein E2C01_049346 [Portunus trituberculatus]|uniref:Uncharacterized protein n=1 Tax=Portunus trituberculatus TaxID=210409 RepID=A0A5B7G653_PORTR|nr:hypothetical protein [Portunus trituberculatus]